MSTSRRIHDHAGELGAISIGVLLHQERAQVSSGHATGNGNVDKSAMRTFDDGRFLDR